MSHGNLIFVGLMVLTHSQNRPPVMLIEEPENGLTPAAVKRFYQAARNLAFKEDQAQRSQVLISFVICEAWNGEDRDFIHQVKVENGACVVRKLSDAIKEHRIPLAKDDSGKRTHLGLKDCGRADVWLLLPGLSDAGARSCWRLRAAGPKLKTHASTGSHHRVVPAPQIGKRLG